MYTETNNLEAVQILLAGGADHLNRTKDGHTPLDITLIGEFIVVMMMIIMMMY